MSERLQTWIHFLELGKGAKIIATAVAVLGFITLAVLYDIGSFRNFNSEEAMDLSQLARNIAQGEGFTTDYIRPVSMNLVDATANRKLAVVQQELQNERLTSSEKSSLEKKRDELQKIISWKTRQPDLANAPLYPLLLAGFLKVVPEDYTISRKKAFQTYTPEIWIAAFNQILFFLSIIVLFRIVRQLFDRAIAITATVLFAATELFWHFSIAGVATMLMLLIFLCITWSLIKFHEASERDSGAAPVFWAVLAGILVGLGCLTRYSLGWLIVPVILFIALFGTRHFLKSSALAFLAFCVVISPWLARNKSLSGNLFGTAGYAICEGTPKFQEDRLERSLDRGSPFAKVYFPDYVRKFMENSRQIFEEKVPHLGASWLTFFFFVGWMIPMQTRAQSRFRYFVLFCLVLFWFVEALGRTHLSIDSGKFSSENLLVLTAPLLFVIGVAVFFDLLRRINFSEPAFSYVATLFFCVVVSAPLIFTLLPPAVSPSAYPPYFPPIIQETSSWMRKEELTMSDVPWAVAWYGNRQSVPLTLTYPKDFLKLTDDIRPVQALYMTPRSTDKRFLSQMVKDRDSWGRFILQSLSKGEVPDGFPLKKAPSGFLPDQVFLTDWERWTLTRK